MEGYTGNLHFLLFYESFRLPKIHSFPVRGFSFPPLESVLTPIPLPPPHVFLWDNDLKDLSVPMVTMDIWLQYVRIQMKIIHIKINYYHRTE